MEIIVEIDDAMLDEPVRKAVSQAVQLKVREVVNRKIDQLQAPIERAVEVYLNKKYTSEQLEAIIAKSVSQEVLDRIRDITE